MRSVVWCLLGLAAFGATGCSSFGAELGPETADESPVRVDAPAPASATTPPPAPASIPVTAEGSKADAPDRHFQAIIPSAASASEGCGSDMFLDDIRVDITTTAAGAVTAANVTANAKQKFYSLTCLLNSEKSGTYAFTLGAAVGPEENVTHVTMSPGASTAPPASLAVEGVFDAGGEITLRWAHTDPNGLSSWKIDATTKLVAAP